MPAENEIAKAENEAIEKKNDFLKRLEDDGVYVVARNNCLTRIRH